MLVAAIGDHRLFFGAPGFGDLSGNGGVLRWYYEHEVVVMVAVLDREQD